MEKFVNCCVIYDNNGNPIDIIESKTITETAFKDLKKNANPLYDLIIQEYETWLLGKGNLTLWKI